MRLNDLKLGARLGLGFGLVLLLAALISMVGWLRLGSTLTGIEQAHAATERANSAQRWESLTLLNVNRTLAIAKSGGHPDVKAHYTPLMKATSSEISEMQKALEADLTSTASCCPPPTVTSSPSTPSRFTSAKSPKPPARPSPRPRNRHA